MHSGMQVPKYISLCEGKRVFSGPVREYMWVKWCDKLHLDTGRAAAVHQVALMQHKALEGSCHCQGGGGDLCFVPCSQVGWALLFFIIIFHPRPVWT